MKNNYSMKMVAIMIVIFISLLMLQMTIYAEECDINKIRKNDKTIKDVICDKDLGKYYLKYSSKKRLIWVESEKTHSKLVLDRFEVNANPELVGSDKEIKFISHEIIRTGGRTFIGAFYAHRSRSNNGMGQCGSGSENYFAAIEISNKSMKKRKVILLESCFESYQLGYEDDRKNTNFLGKVVSGEAVFYWYNYEDIEDVDGRYNFITNALTIIEEPAPDKSDNLTK